MVPWTCKRCGATGSAADAYQATISAALHCLSKKENRGRRP